MKRKVHPNDRVRSERAEAARSHRQAHALISYRKALERKRTKHWPKYHGGNPFGSGTQRPGLPPGYSDRDLE